MQRSASCSAQMPTLVESPGTLRGLVWGGGAGTEDPALRRLWYPGYLVGGHQDSFSGPAEHDPGGAAQVGSGEDRPS